MRNKLEKFDHILEKDLANEMDNVITAGTINPTQVKTITDAVCLMLKTLEYGEWFQDGEEDMGASYRRGRSPMTGRYVSRSAGGSYEMDRMPMHEGSYGRGSYGTRAYNMDAYDLDYSGHSIKDRMVAKLETMVDMAKTDYERQSVMDAIHKIESMN